MDNMNEMDDVLQELENGNNPMEVSSSPKEVPAENKKLFLRLRSLCAVSVILVLIGITTTRVSDNNLVFSAIAVAAALVGVLLLIAFALLYILNV